MAGLIPFGSGLWRNYALPLAPDIPEMQMQVVDWRRYLDAYWGVQLVDEAPAWREYRIDNPSGSLICRSMLMRYEFAMLYALAKDHYRGEGAIVDAGPLTGITSNVLARGVLATRRCWSVTGASSRSTCSTTSPIRTRSSMCRTATNPFSTPSST